MSRLLYQWADDQGIRPGFIEPNKPAQNVVMERFNDQFGDERLNIHWITSLTDARQIIEDWRQDQNDTRPHSSLGYHTPTEMYQQLNRPLETMRRDSHNE
jgi:putative transposase